MIQKTLLLAPGGYKNTWKEKANTRRREVAISRANTALEAATSKGTRFNNCTEALQHLQRKGAPSKSWWHKKENKVLLKTLKSLVEPIVRLQQSPDKGKLGQKH